MVRSEGRRTLGKPRRRWEDNIIIELQKVQLERELDGFSSVRDKWQVIVSAVMNVWVP